MGFKAWHSLGMSCCATYESFGLSCCAYHGESRNELWRGSDGERARGRGVERETIRLRDHRVLFNAIEKVWRGDINTIYMMVARKSII